ncbi:polysaccharide export protein [Mucilaginibacter achroorhodeus]|uniref:Polysaccharide export protein n=1 Tax=Mucilaginibacter achroorhodeus TaxID=2599294 RepID=A0A563U975_9SPHI|nr:MULTISPECIES: polysaccharide biosynthesis/export family protein [Mucilaginibacter]QXV67092.1 polysaccharide export protein [Mucilaginibacter sp. 21P]TWR27941.1 polysaccharide export protein [Mucilaginibacter achroorhodeus]
MRFLHPLLIVAFVVIATSCSYKQNQLLFQNRVSALTDTAQQAPVTPYRIQPQDALQIRNLQNLKYIVDEVPMSSGNGGTSAGGNIAGSGQTYQVEDDGTITLPAIGHVQVAGLTRTQAAKMIEDLYRKNLLKDPLIELKVTNLKVTLLGEVKSPGNIPLLKDNTTLVEIIGQAGGLTPAASEKDVKIIRGKGKGQKVHLIDLSDLNSISDPRTVMQNGDIIYVAQNKRAIRTENLQNFNTWAQPALLLLNTALIIFTLSRQ